MIVNYSSQRAIKDNKDRLKLIDKLLQKAKDGKIKTSSLISNYGTKKYIKSLRGETQVDQDKIDKDTLWDGLYGVITSLETKSSSEILERYKDLWKVE